MSWNDYMRILAQSIDADRFEQLVEKSFRGEYEASVEEACERFEEAMEDPGRLLSLEEAREQARESAGS